MSHPRFADLRAALAKLSVVDRVAQQLKELEPVRKSVNGWAVELPALVAQYRLFASRNVPGLPPTPPGAKVRDAVAAARAKNLVESPLEIKSGRTFHTLETRVTKVVEAYRAAISTSWADWVKAQRPNDADAELIPFENDAEYRAVVVQIRKLLADLRRAEQTPAESATDFAAVTDIADTMREALGKLPTNAPPEVRAFLAATSTREGALLALFTPAVEVWLKANNQFEKYRIKR